MIVRQFLQWIRSAPASERAEATRALARAFLFSDLSPDDRAAAEGAMIMMLDDPSPLVRLALAEVLASAQSAPAAVIHALASDQPEIAAAVLERSPLFIDADLVDLVATGEATTQAAIARRTPLQCAVAAAIAEVGAPEACLLLIENPDAELVGFSMSRIADRFGHLAAIRDVLFARRDLPAAIRQTLVTKLSSALADFVTARAWLHEDRARRVAQEACEKATVALAADVAATEIRPLVRHLCETGQLNAGLILRALLCGNLNLFEEALGQLSALPMSRVRGLVYDQGRAGFRAVYQKAGLPQSAYPAFREAIEAMQDAKRHDADDDLFNDRLSERFGGARLKRRMIERVLTGCERAAIGEVEPLLTLLRRFATEASREEARLYCEDLAADDTVVVGERIAA